MYRSVGYLLPAIAALLAVILFAGCAGLPQELRDQADAIPEQIAQVEQRIAEHSDSFQAVKQSSEYRDFLQRYDERENWDSHFQVARTKLANASSLFDQTVKPLLDRNSPDDAEALRVQLDRLSLAVREAREEAAKPGNRIQFLGDAKSQGPQWVDEAEKDLGLTKVIFDDLAAVVNQAKGDFPDKEADLTSRFAAVRGLYDSSNKAADVARNQVNASDPDYAALGDSTQLVAENFALIQDQDAELRGRLSELDHSYSKMLVDMDVRNSIVVGRTSWNEGADFPAEHDYLYSPRQVDQATYESVVGLPDNQLLAVFTSGFFSGKSLRVGMDQAAWNSLGIDPMESWPGGDDTAEFWLQDAPASYFHKYIITENGQRRETEWEQVTWEFFEANLENLGMDIVTKPYGFYEDEVVNVASPPGMAYVGNPRYGQWREDNQGNRFWDWFGPYLFFSTLLHRPYYYNDWYGWRGGYYGQRPYYGPAGDPNRYGTYSQNTGTRYSSSTWARKGGFERQAASVRGAGPAARGGGPSRAGK